MLLVPSSNKTVIGMHQVTTDHSSEHSRKPPLPSNMEQVLDSLHYVHEKSVHHFASRWLVALYMEFPVFMDSKFSDMHFRTKG